LDPPFHNHCGLNYYLAATHVPNQQGFCRPVLQSQDEITENELNELAPPSSFESFQKQSGAMQRARTSFQLAARKRNPGSPSHIPNTRAKGPLFTRNFE